MIAAVRLINIQSFKDVHMEFNGGRVNVIEAPNETGKSILFKVMRVMCDANWYGRGKRKDLIRNGCKCGMAGFIIPKDKGCYMIQFELYETYQVYRLFDGKDLVNSWKCDVMPDVLADILKWNYDFESKRLLNLCDQELEMPFTGSNGKSNFDSMKFIFNHQRLDIARETLKEWVDELDSLILNVGNKQSELYAVYNSIDYVDTNKLSVSINKREKILREVESLYLIIKSLCECNKLDKPYMEMSDSSDIDNIVEICSLLKNTGAKLQEVYKLDKPVIEDVDCVEMDDIINSVQVISKIRYSAIKALDMIKKKDAILSSIVSIESLIKDFEAENKICPLCGNTFR